MGISVDFFSSGYLDVSVPRVSFLTDSPKTGFPHSEIAGSKLVCQLPRAYRRLQRPSSPLIAKASTVCTSVLDHTILELTKRSFTYGTDYTINADIKSASPNAPVIFEINTTYPILLITKLVNPTC